MGVFGNILTTLHILELFLCQIRGGKMLQRTGTSTMKPRTSQSDFIILLFIGLFQISRLIILINSISITFTTFQSKKK
jgi:hypothetical protein